VSILKSLGEQTQERRGSKRVGKKNLHRSEINVLKGSRLGRVDGETDQTTKDKTKDLLLSRKTDQRVYQEHKPSNNKIEKGLREGLRDEAARRCGAKKTSEVNAITTTRQRKKRGSSKSPGKQSGTTQ